MVKRASVLSLLVLLSVFGILFLIDPSSAHSRGTVAGHPELRHHSRAWWRRRRMRLRRRHAEMAARRATAHWGESARVNSLPAAGAVSGGVYTDHTSGFSISLPAGWTSRPIPTRDGMRFSLFAPGNVPAGEATISAVASPPGGANSLPSRLQRQSIGGVPLAQLRHSVIEKMITSNGWVTNDFEREIAGHRVFVVIAQTPAPQGSAGGAQSWAFYFAEVDGAVYRLATDAPVEFTDRMAADAGQMLASLRGGSRGMTTSSALR